ncbi:HAMP domain-containing protein [Candidatus Poribacteria bacterium]|nr:HAMP domain-containing protein [Candidatus Poribacteria bacterium]MYK19458.1 HAMP domain-containing protein [Candidatus Poribacteria bacterium]
MRNKFSALRLQDKIFIAYGFVFLVMFGVIFGSTNFLIRLAFKREIDSYVKTLQAQVSNKYRAFVETVEKKVHAAATDVRLHRAIERQSDYVYLPATEFDLLAYGTPDGKLLYPDFGGRRDARRYDPLESREGHIQLRSMPQQGDIGLQFVVQATEAGEWGFVTGGDRLQTWLEAQTNIQSDEHPIFLVEKPQIPDSASFGSEPKMDVDNWLPLNNASRETHRDGWSEAFSNAQSAREVFLQETEENGGSAYTAFRITPFNSPFAIAREATPVDLIVAYSHKRQMAWQQRLTLTLLLSGLGGLVLVYLISYIISRLVTRPVEMLREGVSHIAAGDLDHRVKIQSLNEIGQLAEGFNHMAQELKRSLEERMAAERAATWRDVARQVAHEIKNPLFPIRLSVENLQQAKSNPEVFEQIFGECTDTVIEEVDRIGKLIDEFHQFARMPKLQKKPSQLNNIVRSALNLYMGRQIPNLEQNSEASATDIMPEDTVLQNSIDKFWLENVSKIKVETELARLPQLSLDPEQIAQALGNLFKNAIEAMPDGGTLKVKTYFTPNGSQGNSEPRTANSGQPKTIKGTVSLEIQDTGRGMSEETMANLFVPYYTTKVETDGTGLGMPIVKRIVTEHSAEMDCQSAENVGTTVRIRFPYDPNAPSEDLAAESVSAPVAGKPEELTIPETKEQTIDPQT